MSRFDSSRRGRIAVWTGAALAWGTAVVLANQQPAEAETETPTSGSTFEVETTSNQSLPAMPAQGLVIIRHRPAPEASPEVRTVYVRQKTSSPAGSASAPAPAPAKAPAPAPKSGGS